MSTPQGQPLMCTLEGRYERELGEAVLTVDVYGLHRLDLSDAKGMILVSFPHRQLPPSIEIEYISISRAAEETGISEAELKDMIETEIIKTVLIQGTPRLLRQSLDQYIKTRGDRRPDTIK